MIITQRNKLFDCNNTLKTALHPQLKRIKTQANTEMGTFISAQISPPQTITPTHEYTKLLATKLRL